MQHPDRREAIQLGGGLLLGSSCVNGLAQAVEPDIPTPTAAQRTWQDLCNGTSVGHKRLQPISPVEVARVRLRVDQCIATPSIRQLAVYGAE